MQKAMALPEELAHVGKEDLIEIYEHFSPRLYRYAFRLLGQPDMAEECVAETFSRFLLILKKGGGPKDNLSAYLYRMAHNWITDYYRKQPPVDPLEFESIGDSVENLAAIVTKKMERERVRSALLQLTPEQRQVIVLRFFEDWPHEEIASLIGKTTEATRALQHRALIGLQKLLIEPEV
jgi:RNA polymerase sigma-70 factor (ECF subfamily)